jgi:hypothetical protein
MASLSPQLTFNDRESIHTPQKEGNGKAADFKWNGGRRIFSS